MIAELGHYALMLALGLALIQGSMPIVGARSNDPALMSMAAPTALAQFAFVAIAFARQLYLSLGDPNPDGTVPVRLYFKPQVLMIWLAAIIMFVGGGLSLSGRRLRVGAPKPAGVRVTVQPAE